MPRADLLALSYAAATATSVGVFGFSLLSVGIPAALLVALLADGIARPGSSLLYPTVTHGSRKSPLVALSFDDGPDPEVTPAVLDALAQYGARATFFTIGRSLQAHPLLARRLAAERHELGNHSWAHSRWQSFFRTPRQLHDIERGAQAIAAFAGNDSGGPARPLFRPPVGIKSPPMVMAVQRLQLTVVAWSLHSRDTSSSDSQAVVQRVLKKIRPGDIVLMHDGHDVPDRHRPVCAQALPRILEGLREKGLQCVTISELLRAGETTAA